MAQPKIWKARIKRAVADPAGFSYKALNAARWNLRRLLLNLFCDVLYHWGHKLGVSGNFRARMFWKAGRQDIVPITQLYEYMSQKYAYGQFYLTAPKWSARSQTIINVLSPFVTKDHSFLEIGCSLGRNLND